MRSIMKCSTALFFLASFAMVSFHATSGQAQLRNLPRVSPAASVTQRIGITDITIDYHRPGVKDRVIWGKLVPYNSRIPWRAGANDNTTITFTHDVTIENQQVPAGSYGVHMNPTEGELTISFSKNHTSWGSFFYKPEEDAVRINVTPQKVEHTEWLNYGFEDLTDNSAVAYLRWEELKVPFKIEVDLHEIVLGSIRNELRTLPAFSWRGWRDAARYCLRNDIINEEAMGWIDESVKREKNFNNLQVKSQLLAKADQPKESEDTMNQAVEMANQAQLNRYSRQLLGEDKTDKAIAMFKLNVKRHPKEWRVYDSLAEAYEKKGDRKAAMKNYKKALSKAPDDQKERIQNALAKIEGTN